MKLGIMAAIFQKDSYALGSGTFKAGIAGDFAPRAVFSLVRRPMMLGIMAGMDHKGLFKFVDIPFVLQRQILMVQTIQQTTEFPQLLYKVVGVPVCRSCRFPCRDAEADSHGQACLADHGDFTSCSSLTRCSTSGVHVGCFCMRHEAW